MTDRPGPTWVGAVAGNAVAGNDVAGNDVAGNDLVQRVREICLGLPGTTEKISHGAPSFFVKRQYAAVRPDGHHDRAEPHLVCAAPPGVQAELVDDEPERFFVPPYVGGRGWIGVLLTGDVDWDEIGHVLAEAHATIGGR